MDDPAAFRRQARWHRQLAQRCEDEQARLGLLTAAEEYEREAARLESLGPATLPPRDPDQCYRFVAPAMHGTWRFTLEEALNEAIAAGQAEGDPARPETFTLFGGVRIETHVLKSCEAECRRAALAELIRTESGAAAARSAAETG